MIKNNRLLLACLLIATVAGCRSPQRVAPEPTPPFISPPGVSVAPSPSPSPSPSRTARRLATHQAGDICDALGAIGATPDGRRLVCDHSHSEFYLRWRYAS